MTEGFIYSITLKGQDKPFYIGQTRQCPARRWNAHMRGRTPVSQALQLFGSADDFEFAIVETVPEPSMNAREEFWIEKLGTLHPNGLNMTKGGNASKRSAKVKARVADKSKAMWRDPDYRAKMLSVLSGRAPLSEDARARLGASIKTKWATDPDYRAKLTAARKGKLLSEDTKAKKSEAMKIRWGDPAYSERVNQAKRGRARSNSSKASVAAGMKARWADPEFRRRAVEARWGHKEAGVLG